MTRASFLTFRRDSTRRKSHADKFKQQPAIPWIASVLEQDEFGAPRLRTRSEASPIELFYDVFLVANLATFTATHEINNVDALLSYVGFLAVIWFTWLQVTLFDLRFARDSIFERLCKCVQLAAMVGFASAGSRFSTHISEENVWAFRSLSMLLAGSRFMLAIQYSIHIWFIRPRMPAAVKGMYAIVAILVVTSVVYFTLYFVYGRTDPHIWAVWFGLFLCESLVIMGVSSYTPGIEIADTHLSDRMQLLTLIIIGESVISVTRIVNKIVAGGGWTLWSFVHILGVTTTVYLLWHSYYDISPRRRFNKLRQQIWTHLHFPFHVSIILLSEGSQILALTLDIVLKLRYLADTFLFACETPRPTKEYALRLLNSTITDMEIDFARAQEEKKAITRILNSLWDYTYLCGNEDMQGADNFTYGLTEERSRELMGNVTVSLFSSMGITSTKDGLNNADGKKLVKTYISLLTFVYVYYFIAVSLSMVHFAAFASLTHRHCRPTYNGIAITFRLAGAVLLMGLVLLAYDFDLVYHFMTSPIIIFVYPLVLLAVLLVDRFLDWFATRPQSDLDRHGSTRSTAPMMRHAATDRLSFQYEEEIRANIFERNQSM